MPGSLLLSNDARSDLSALSSKSLDSKLSAKKVSFNKAVRVKQYPWRPEAEIHSTDHLTLPSNRFWFKVYRNRHESAQNKHFGIPLGTPTWNEESVNSTHDSLAPIAEVEDQEIENNTLSSIQEKLKRYDKYGDEKEDENNFSYNSYEDIDNQPTEPPIDYYEDTYSDRNTYLNNAKSAWELNDTPSNQNLSQRYTFHPNSISNNYNAPHNKLISEESDSSNLSLLLTKDLPNVRLPRMTARNDLTRRSERRWNAFDNSKPRERRSRSHDDHFDHETILDLKKADKSVSTEDLNSNFSLINSPNRFFKPSRDIATQCYGTLSKDRNGEKLNSASTPLFTRSQLNPNLLTDVSNRINNFKSSPSKSPLYSNDIKADSVINKTSKRDNSFFSNDNRLNPKTNNLTTNASTSNSRNFNSSFRKYDPLANSEIHSENSKLLTRRENVVSNAYKSNASKSDYTRQDFRYPNTYLSRDSLKSLDNNRDKLSSTVGYVRGRQIPLTEVNTNTNRRVIGRNEMSNNRSAASSKFGRGTNTSSAFNGTNKSQETTGNQQSNKKHLISNAENIRGKNTKTDNSSSKKYLSNSNNEDSTMIDWSLSGFQLAPKSDNGIMSVSDSECTVNRRPPLLMYIPGVSYHNRPADEDDRLSALSDMSRTELSDGLSPLSYFSNKDNGFRSDIRRRYSMPKDSKVKWMKWKNNAKK
ncbi:GATA zinc finger domain-containing protein 14-like [Uloborus diversus]|uniref:GATA zinc finger domain-containing protein 14-like n=1 Tax=Uloborus diversus TaxID=327109 RepID=UPI00240A334D|nr:GATA zinc finger domain-containing protein 14-like [Uloborus diversus]XP_054708282.1 GATA zinc finger domain-containing protein 14-like [Uloborus diversus]